MTKQWSNYTDQHPQGSSRTYQTLTIDQKELLCEVVNELRKRGKDLIKSLPQSEQKKHLLENLRRCANVEEARIMHREDRETLISTEKKYKKHIGDINKEFDSPALAGKRPLQDELLIIVRAMRQTSKCEDVGLLDRHLPTNDKGIKTLADLFTQGAIRNLEEQQHGRA